MNSFFAGCSLQETRRGCEIRRCHTEKPIRKNYTTPAQSNERITTYPFLKLNLLIILFQSWAKYILNYQVLNVLNI